MHFCELNDAQPFNQILFGTERLERGFPALLYEHKQSSVAQFVQVLHQIEVESLKNRFCKMQGK